MYHLDITDFKIMTLLTVGILLFFGIHFEMEYRTSKKYLKEEMTRLEYFLMKDKIRLVNE